MAHLVTFKPVVTEKSMRLSGEGKYTFRVNRNASKLAIARSIGDAHSVTVLAVNIVKTPPKPKQRGAKSATTKAVVTLKKGESIKGFEMPMPQEATSDTATTDKKPSTTDKRDK